MSKSKVAVVYHFFPHYRAGILKELEKDDSFSFEFYGANIDEYDGIKSYQGFNKFHEANFRRVSKLVWQNKIVGLAFKKDIEAVIFLADPHFLSTWVSSILCRLGGKRVIFWTHGWTKKLPWYKGFVKNIFHKLAHSLLLYGNYAKEIAINNGFKPENCHVVYNSLDYEKQLYFRNHLDSDSLRLAKQSLFPDKELPMITAVSRLTPECSYDLLVFALTVLRAKYNIECNLLFIGDGPEKEALEDLCLKHKLKVNFYGACYDEKKLSSMIAASNLVVSPGKVGLTAMHSLNYGTAVISHDRFDLQMPEFEAISDGKTGAFFKYNDHVSLADTIKNWLDKEIEQPNLECMKIIDLYYNPRYQKSVIDLALKGLPASRVSVEHE